MKVPRGVVANEPDSDLQGLYREVSQAVSLAVVTTNCEKSAEVIVGNLCKQRYAEGLNNKTCKTNVCPYGYPTVDVGKRVCANKGAGGVDGMELTELHGYIRKNWKSIREQIRERKYKPQPVRRVEIPKPDGSKRKLGIPTVMDRVIQQGIAQVISPMCEPCFSEHSYGFRPNRSCEMAIKEMLVFLNEGYEWIVT